MLKILDTGNVIKSKSQNQYILNFKAVTSSAEYLSSEKGHFQFSWSSARQAHGYIHCFEVKSIGRRGLWYSN